MESWSDAGLTDNDTDAGPVQPCKAIAPSLPGAPLGPSEGVPYGHELARGTAPLPAQRAAPRRTRRSVHGGYVSQAARIRRRTRGRGMEGEGLAGGALGEGAAVRAGGLCGGLLSWAAGGRKERRRRRRSRVREPRAPAWQICVGFERHRTGSLVRCLPRTAYAAGREPPRAAHAAAGGGRGAVRGGVAWTASP
eukprot:365478-Chlamydomonas_euryale.AAC.14